jgi:hypothetical protein
LQKKYYREHGTTLQGLMLHHGIDPNDFLEKVHDIDYSWVKPDPELGDAIRRCRDASSSSPMAILRMPSAPRRPWDSRSFRRDLRHRCSGSETQAGA